MYNYFNRYLTERHLIMRVRTIFITIDYFERYFNLYFIFVRYRINVATWQITPLLRIGW